MLVWYMIAMNVEGLALNLAMPSVITPLTSSFCPMAVKLLAPLKICSLKTHLDGSAAGAELTLDETFRFSDGETDRRVWTITRAGDGRFTGTAGDILGEALKKAGN